MANLRLINLRAVDSRIIKGKFTHRLDPSINTSNVTVESLIVGVPNAEVLKVSIVNDIITITVKPLIPNAAYLITFKTANGSVFRSINGDAVLFEDGRTNVRQITGPEEPANEIRDVLLSLLINNVYNLNRGTFVRFIINQIATNLLKARHDIKQAKNDNYLKVLVTDERKVRGRGPTDRLNEEGVYEILRVGRTATNTTLSTSFSFDSFPREIITLLKIEIENEKLIAGNQNQSGTFNGLILTVSKKPITKVSRIFIEYQDGYEFEYDIQSLGYQLKDSRYDEQFASTFILLDDNQIGLSEAVLNTSGFVRVPTAGDLVYIDYEYKSLGRFVDASSVAVTQVLNATREPTPALVNQLSLNAPIVTSSGAVATSSGVIFLDPDSATPFLTIHPAFTDEIPFKANNIPAAPGEYSVDYETGRVFVYGATTDKEGTGNFPPAATYKYLKTYRSGLDYTYDSDTADLVANPERDLIAQQASVSFDYEENFVPEIDFKLQIHQEAINERIDNRLRTTNSLSTLNTPITNVFRIFNETTGEIYNPTRFNGNVVFFSANTPPRIFDKRRERASFINIVNEPLLTAEELRNSSNVRIFKVPLLNNKIISITDDLIGSSFSTSVSFSKTDIFVLERYFDGQVIDLNTNLNRLSVEQYTIDYANGIIYVAVSDTQNYDIGTVNYKKSVITPKNPHIISVDDIYHSININLNPNKRIEYTSFEDGAISPADFDISDERFLNGDETLQYTIESGTITVTDDVKRVRHIFDVADLLNNFVPTDFGSMATASGNVITLGEEGVEKQETLVVSASLTIDVSTISSGIQIGEALSVVRVSDNTQLLDGYETVAGNTIQLSGSSGASSGDIVVVIYTVILNSSATPIIDYDRGDYFIDYTYLADEILVSYEYGDNVLDFTESDTILEGNEYFVSYRFGALRDALLPNFGSLVDIPEVQTFDIELKRENYRNILLGALQTFTKGPTVPAMKQLISTVTKITPELIESVFQTWSLGFSHLFRNEIEMIGEPELVAGKFDQGLAVRQSGQAISFPVSSNLRLEQGALEMWVIPDWAGLDNDATITFSNLTRDGYELNESEIFIGASSFNPSISDDGAFIVNKSDNPSPIGLPSAVFTQIGMFIYYDTDENIWKVLVKDSVSSDHVYTGKITSSGEVYNAKLMTDLADPSDSIKTGLSTIEYTLNIDGYDFTSPDGYMIGDGYVDGYSFDGISFMADDQHYLFDFAEKKDKNRFSLYKDGSGYLNFTVWDRGGRLPNKSTQRNRYNISADIQDWEAGQAHHVAVSWELNSPDRRDEMHLFIDGEEVPNILRYGGRPIGTSSDRFRTVKPEIIAGIVPKNAIAGNDLSTTQGSNTVISASVDFEAQGIIIGDIIQILETGFTIYTITLVDGNVLELSANMPATLSDASFSVNPYSVTVTSQVDLFTNIAISVIRGADEIEIPGLRADIPGYSLSKNMSNENIVTILGNVLTGDQIVIRTLGLNHRRARETVYLWGDEQSILKTHLPPPINLDEVSIKAILLPLTSIGLNNAIIVGPDFVATGLQASQPTNPTEGRQLEVRVTGGNVNFSSPTTITINGTTAGGPLFETLAFTSAGSQITTNKFKTITSIDVTTTPLTTSSNGIAFEIKEAFAVTIPNGNSLYPVIRFAFKTQFGTTLEGDGSTIVSDSNGFFPLSDVDNLLLINSPGSVAGTYSIVDKIDNNIIEISPATGTAFSNGIYEIYSVSIGRSGFQNGFFILEQAGSTNTPYPLPQGYYEFDYSTYLEVPFDPINQTAFVGNDYTLTKPAKAVIDELRISSQALTDTRIGESLGINEESVTTSFLALDEFIKNTNTLMLLHFDEDPLINDSDYWRSANNEYVQSGSSVNDNFSQSILITDRGLSFDNKGTLVTRDQGSIEFWVSPRFDTYNDPNFRFYFDAASSVVEEITSLTKGTVKVSGRIAEVLSVRLQTDTQNTGIDFFAGGSIEEDRQTISLKKPLPFQQTPIKVVYTPSGLSGDRLSIYKDQAGFIAFNVRAQGIDYQARTPVFWTRDSWHRIRATFKFNRSDNLDEIRLFIDGEERGVILFGSGILFGQGYLFGQTVAGVTNQILIADINFTDPVNRYFIGTDYLGANAAQARIDNFRISNVARTPISIGGQPFDVNFISNTATAFPVIEDAFTTFLMDFEHLVEKIDDFAILRDEHFGVFNFTLNILDSFGILSDSERVRNVLESMIFALKPANAKPEINYL